MPSNNNADLASIRTFPSLVAYLRDKMGWPIEGYDFEDLTFDYDADELGIDRANAATIQEIKRLRPLTTNQPWGIFFVKFEPKRLPVVALRRILSRVVLKKRASANSAERTAWRADDLLFVSNFGQGDERQISFAHFSQDDAKDDLPTLKVLGWDDRDTPLHLKDVADKLTTNLAWPDDAKDVAQWRATWRSAFTLRHREVINTSKDLSIQLAKLARAIRDRIGAVLAIETENGPVTKLMKAFQEALIHDLDADGFADTYAQTIAYGLLSARVTNPKANTADSFATQLPVTNPFLKELMETFLQVGGRKGKAGRGPGIDFDELGVSEVVELLDDANMEAVLVDFGDRNPQEDPVIHFYELFLKEYDAKKRMQRGVFYTPRPVVSYIVRSVHELLRTEFGLADGLADIATWGEMAQRYADLKIPEGTKPTDCFVAILDPATGTGTFLVEAIDVIHRTLVEKWSRAGHGESKVLELWNDYVPRHMLPRLHGYELLMAPYAIAHLKIGLKLHETGYRFGSAERARIYLTNSLEPPVDSGTQFQFALPALAHEAEAVGEVKRNQRFTVVVGNPPYSKSSSNREPDAEALASPFKASVREERNIQPLSDDYVKFLGLVHSLSTRCPMFAWGMITNRGYVSGLIHRGIRQVLLEDFAYLRLLDLHGDSNVGELAPRGIANENVFDIQQGVAITVGLKAPHLGRSLLRFDSWGTRDEKYAQLTSTVGDVNNWINCAPMSPQFFFQARTQIDERVFESWFSLPRAMPITTTGIKTHRDGLVIDFDAGVLEDRIRDFADSGRSDDNVRQEYFGTDGNGRYLPGDNRDWSMIEGRRGIRKFGMPIRRFIRRIDYRPFDCRFIYYHQAAIDFGRHDMMVNMDDGTSLGLVATRQVPNGPFCHVFVTRRLIEMKTGSHDRGTNLFPLILKSDPDAPQIGNSNHPNYSEQFLRALADALAVTRVGDYGLPLGLTPNDVFDYAYAVLHSPRYRALYASYLRTDFPRLPLPGSIGLFRKLAGVGAALVALHLLEASMLDHFITTYTGPKNPEVGRVGWSDDTVWLDAAATTKGQSAAPGTIGFRGVPEAVWNFHIGGYQVCEKWLKDRKGRMLSKDDITHYQKIVVALSETIRLMKEIDEVIEQHGGWPGAFQTGPAAAETSGALSAPNVVEEYLAEEEPPAATEYGVERPALLEFAEPKPPAYGEGKAGAAPPNIEDIDRDDLMCAIRQLFSDGQTRPRDQAIKDLARALGYQRVGPRIDETLDNALRTAVRRGVLANGGDALSLLARSVTDYERDFLKEQFLASMQGRTYQAREDVIRQFARWLGFRRTGPVVDEIARSLINGLLREDRLETEGGLIRRKG